MTLKWRTVTHSQDARFLVKGTELSVAIVPDTLSRFQICEIRSYYADGQPDRVYMVRDAHAVTDDQLRAGVRPPVVERFMDLDAALIWCKAQK